MMRANRRASIVSATSVATCILIALLISADGARATEEVSRADNHGETQTMEIMGAHVTKQNALEAARRMLRESGASIPDAASGEVIAKAYYEVVVTERAPRHEFVVRHRVLVDAETGLVVNLLPHGGNRMEVSPAEAIDIAARELVQRNLEIDALHIEVRDGQYVVTLPIHLPPRARGPDFQARLFIDGQTGEVARVLRGS